MIKIVNLGNYINNYKSSLAGAQRIFEFLDMEKEDNTPHLDDVRRLSGDSDEGIVFDHVYFRYDKEKQIHQNEMVCILSPPLTDDHFHKKYKEKNKLKDIQ